MTRRKWMLSNISCILVVTMSHAALAYDLSYYQTLSEAYLNEGNLDDALSRVEAGLREYPNDETLKQLRSQINANIEGRKSVKNSSKDDVKSRQHEPTKTDRLQIAYCSCRQVIADFEAAIKSERDGERHSGLVNSQRLYEAGQGIARTEQILKHLVRAMSQDGVSISNCEGSPKLGGLDRASCLIYATENINEIMSSE